MEEVQTAEYDRAVRDNKPSDFEAKPFKRGTEVRKMPLPMEEVVNDQNEPTGDINFTFAIVAGGIAKKTKKPYDNKPAMFDAKGKPCSIDLYSGAEGKITFIISAYTNPKGEVFVSLKPRAVQVLKLAGGAGGSRDASQYGFGADDEGFDASEFDGAQGGGDSPDFGDNSDASALL